MVFLLTVSSLTKDFIMFCENCGHYKDTPNHEYGCREHEWRIVNTDDIDSEVLKAETFKTLDEAKSRLFDLNYVYHLLTGSSDNPFIISMVK